MQPPADPERGAAWDAARVKRRAKALGADLVGIASAETLNAFPPDPRWPQTPDRISPYCASVIVVANRIPVGAFRCKSNVPVQYLDMLVLRKMDRLAYRLAEELERDGHPTFVTAAQETEWTLKRASYGRLSTRHLGVEAGLGTLGLEVNILTPEFGPRLYLTGILTELELEPDPRMTEQVCIGESCSRCLHSCPPNAVLHWGIAKRECATEAQEFGFAQILKFFDRMIERPDEDKMATFRGRDFFGFWQGLLRVVGSFGDCPRCLAVCPVGRSHTPRRGLSLLPRRTAARVRRAQPPSRPASPRRAPRATRAAHPRRAPAPRPRPARASRTPGFRRGSTRSASARSIRAGRSSRRGGVWNPPGSRRSPPPLTRGASAASGSSAAGSCNAKTATASMPGPPRSS
jgi:epoxyqueuosine reductase QueG